MKQLNNTLIVIAGFAGSGKSTVSKILSKKYSIPRLEIDFFGRESIKMDELKNISADKKFAISYKITFKLAKELLNNGQSVILDINMCNPLSWQELSKIRKYNKKIFILKCPFEICKKRVGERFLLSPKKQLIDGWNVDEVKYKWDFIEKKNYKSIIKIDAAQNIKKVVKAIIDLI